MSTSPSGQTKESLDEMFYLKKKKKRNDPIKPDINREVTVMRITKLCKYVVRTRITHLNEEGTEEKRESRELGGIISHVF